MLDQLKTHSGKLLLLTALGLTCFGPATSAVVAQDEAVEEAPATEVVVVDDAAAEEEAATNGRYAGVRRRQHHTVLLCRVGSLHASRVRHA